MEALEKRISNLESAVSSAMLGLEIQKKSEERDQLAHLMQDTGFWGDTQKAQQITKEHSKLDEQVTYWQNLHKSIKETLELIELKDTSLEQDLEKQILDLEQEFEKAKKELLFSGEFDNRDVILGLFAGAGGTDAQDWTQMLLRMYVRWAEAHKLSVKMIDQTSGEEAGIKSATLEISGGSNLYGKLKSEHGVHRLVRLSPFNSDNLRQTSFAKIDILPKIDKPEDISIDDKDLKIDVYRAGGHGGQSVNTTDSAVRITHIPTNITVSIQNERSQLQNKETAMTIIRSRLAHLRIEQHKDSLEQIKGPNQSAEWGNQIRSYVLHPYKQVKDLRTKHESTDPDKVLDGGIDEFIDSYLEQELS